MSIKIPGYQVTTDKAGKKKIALDQKAKHRKMSVSDRIAAKASSGKKIRYGKPLLETRPRKGGE